MSEFYADRSIDNKDRLAIILDKDSASVCMVYNGRFSQIILSKEDTEQLKAFINEEVK